MNSTAHVAAALLSLKVRYYEKVPYLHGLAGASLGSTLANADTLEALAVSIHLWKNSFQYLKRSYSSPLIWFIYGCIANCNRLDRGERFDMVVLAAPESLQKKVMSTQIHKAL